MQKRLALGMAVAGTLACAGVATPPGPAPEPPPAADVALLAFRPASGGCEWTLWSARKGSRAIGATPACPTQLVFKPDGSKVVYTTEGAAHVSAWPMAGPPVTIPFPDQPVLRWHPLWVASDGVLRLQAAVEPKTTEKGDELVLSAGAIRTSAWKLPGGGYSYSVKDGKAVRPGADARELVPFGTWILDLNYEANRKGAGWTLLSALPDKLDPDVGFRPRVEPDAWPSLAAGYSSCNTGQQCENPAWKERADLKGLLGPDVAPGFLPAGPGGWLFAVRWGDTPHAQGPVFSCADPSCSSPVPLVDLPPGDPRSLTYTLQPRDEYLLVGEERTGAHARVYRLGRAEPVVVLADAERVSWLPQARGR